MHPLEKKVKKTIRQYNLFATDELVLVAVSGGADSLSMLHILAGLRRFVGIRLAVCYVDHSLRPDETEAEKRLVAGNAEALSVPFRAGRVEVDSHAREHGYSTEQAARELRYEFLSKTAYELKAGCLAVAHTADDQAEELLLRLIRGTARKGLSGMERQRWLGNDLLGKEGSGLRLVRPLLGIRKYELLSYLQERGIVHAEDSSNQDLRFLRNRVRRELLPMLAEQFNPNIETTLCRTAEILREEDELLEKMTQTAFVLASLPTAEGLVFDRKQFNDQPIAIRRRMLEKAIIAMSLQPSTRYIDQLLKGAASGGEGVVADLAKGVRVVKKKGRICFEQSEPGPRRRVKG